jgi:hypothetical protein
MSEAEQKMWESQVNELLYENSPHELARMMVSSRVENKRLRAEVERLRGGGEAVGEVAHYNEANLSAGIKLVPLLNGKSPVDIGTKLYTHPAPAVPDCPYPCGWVELHNIASKKAAYFARATMDEVPDGVRSAGIDLGRYALDVIRLMLPNPQPEEPK